MTLGEKIIHYREEKGMTTKEVAKMLGMSRQTVSAYESNKQSPTVETLERISDILGIRIALFFLDNIEVYSHITEEMKLFYINSLVTSYHANITILPRLYYTRVKDIFSLEELACMFANGARTCETMILAKDLSNLGEIVNALSAMESDILVLTSSATYITDEIKNKGFELKGVFR